MGAAHRIYPLLEVAEHREAGTYYSIIHEYPMNLAAAQLILADKTRHIQPATHSNRGWNRLHLHLHRLPTAKVGNVNPVSEVLGGLCPLQSTIFRT
ncbi:P22AR C-terminal domain-containing protein [Aeromonas veronii]